MSARRRLVTDLPGAVAEEFQIQHRRAEQTTTRPPVAPSPAASPTRPAAMVVREADASSPAYSIRRSGDRHLLVEAGEAELDLSVRVWIHLRSEERRVEKE